MSFVHVDDVLGDRELAETMDPALVALLARLSAAATADNRPHTDSFDAFTVTVKPNGEIEVGTDTGNGFGDWVWAAGDLALHVGPKRGLVNGEVRSVTEILGADDYRVEPDDEFGEGLDDESVAD